MAAGSVGLTTYRFNNNLKSLVLLALYPLIIGGVVWLCALLWGMQMAPGFNGGTVPDLRFSSDWATGWMYQWWPLIAAGVSIWFVIAYFAQTRMIRKIAHSHPVTRRDEPALYNMLENLCISRGIPMPRLEIMETHARNAFASGVDRRTYCITVSRGLMTSLTPDEVEAVLAHELTHIMRNDVRLLIVTIIFMGMFGFAAQMAWDSLRFSTRGRGKKGAFPLVMLGMVLVLYLGYFATLWSRFAISRRREYDADAGAVQLTKKPEAMMSALMRISGREKLPDHNADIAMMCIENTQPFFGIFATHPPIESRIRMISKMTGTAIPQISRAPVEKAQSFDPAPSPRPWVNATKNPWAPTPVGVNPWSRLGAKDGAAG